MPRLIKSSVKQPNERIINLDIVTYIIRDEKSIRFYFAKEHSCIWAYTGSPDDLNRDWDIIMQQSIDLRSAHQG